MLAVDIVCQKHRLHFLGLIIAIEKIAEASGEERNQLRGFFALHSAESFSHAQQLEPAVGAAGALGRAAVPEKTAADNEPVFSADRPRARMCPRRAAKVCEIQRWRVRDQPTTGTTCPSGNGTSKPGSQGTIRSPCAPRSRSRIIVGRNMLAMYEVVEARQPGAISSVTQQPPTISRRSRTRVENPARER